VVGLYTLKGWFCGRQVREGLVCRFVNELADWDKGRASLASGAAVWYYTWADG